MTKSIANIGRRSLSFITAGIMAVHMLPAVPAAAAEADSPAYQKPTPKKACSLSVSDSNVTLDQPFATKTAGSKNFRIPTFITLENGDLIGTADARWEYAADGGGLDIIASVSSDGGKTWNYSFPFFFPDSNGFSGRNTSAPYWSDATTIIDSCILEGPDGTVYCFADVNPTGATTLYQNRHQYAHEEGRDVENYIGNNKNLPCTGSVGTGTGYVTVDGKRRLALTEDYTKVLTEPTDEDLITYPYYVGDFTDGYAPILKREDHAPTGYGVDEWYNIYSVNDHGEYINSLEQNQVGSATEVNTDPLGKVQQNVYYEGSKYHIYCIAHIWMVTSKDHGRTWTDPVDINDQVKRHENEHAILVSPGQGIVTSDGTIVFGVYDNSGTIQGEQENASIVYSSDRGKTWKRTEDIPDMWSSENEIVEIEDGKGTLRMFFRNGNNAICYADAEKDETGEYHFKRPVNTRVSVTSGCNVSAISYSKKIDGKQAIMVACPTSNGRANGKIHTFLVNDDENHTMELKNAYSLGGGAFAYCCLTEQADGSLALLWEKGNGGGIFFNSYDVKEVVPDGAFGSAPIKVEVAEGEDYTLSYEGDVTIDTEPDASTASVSVVKNSYLGMCSHSGIDSDSSLDSFVKTVDKSLNISDAEFTFTASGNDWQIKNETKNLYLTNAGADSFFNVNAANMQVSPVSGKDTFYIRQQNNGGYVMFYAPQMNFNRNSQFQANETGYELTLLEKQEEASDRDIIPGYRKVSGASGIKNGGRYLIAYIWDDGNIMILYPTNGKYNQTKHVNLENRSIVSVLTFTGVGEGITQAVMNGVSYRIWVTKDHPQPDAGCSHNVVRKNQLAESCEEDGYTGDQVCTKCHGMIEEGEVVLAFGHTWDAGSLSRAVTETENGVWIYQCSNDASHTKTEPIYALAYEEFMNEYQAAVNAKENEGMYIQESFDQLTQALAGCEAAAAGSVRHSVLYQKTDALRAGNAALVKKSADVIKNDLRAALEKAAKDTSSAGIDAGIWTEFTTARANAEEAAENGKTAEDFWQAFKALTAAQQNLDAAKGELKTAQEKLAEAVKKAQNIYHTNGAGYTPGSWKIFSDAYNAACKVSSDASAEALNKLLLNLEKAQKGLVLQSKPAVKKGDTITVKDVEYKVLDTAKKTVSAAKCKNKKASSVTVQGTVTISGTVYKVIQIDAKAFNGCKLRKVTIGVNVETIGANAFKGCNKLKTVNVKNKSKLKKVGSGAFKKTAKNISIKLPKNLKKNKNLKKQIQRAGIKKIK